ncbi:hypothetical protein I302_103320 [Kwoniella bestiolae CBS 10118]|uniref:BHLH domain-containing protein n=1 Tax=Kwoniella bestiolae CBS 10118 TaxID=1296100 RepID=A0A1B9G825_9TREE|nr:hypothetical protein I302_02023 [Kwoniella bestiolae CBS 10118]OCF27185.1 hypothetical protein I302_02023 [Kwoniella bestiolae CBS 10118]
MTSSKDEKPIIDSDGNARHRSQSISPNEERRSLPPLSSSPHSLSIDIELSRKRKERDGDEVLLSPSTPNSTSSFLMTPQFTAVEGSPNSKRRLSIIEHLALKEEDSTFSGPDRLVSIKGEEPFPWYKSSYDLPSFPHHQDPITVFPVQYQIYQQPNQNQNNNTNGTPQQGTDNSAAQQNTNSVPLDPTLSSMRSSVAPNSNGQQQPQNLLDPSLNTAPEIRFPDAETLASATASPSKDGVPGEVNTQAALAAVSTPTLSAEDAAALLSVPQQDDDGSQSMKKEQPFSRSPELRVSHKLAERKRRKEMKELFDELRDELPSDRGMKASKWEILSKAIDHIRQLKTGHEQMVREIDHLRREVDIARGGTGAYTHSYPTYNLAGTYPPTQNNFATTPATTTPVTANANNGQQQPQQVQQQQPQQVQQVQQQQPQQVQPVQQQQQQQQAQPDQLNQIKADVPQTTTQ